MLTSLYRSEIERRHQAISQLSQILTVTTITEYQMMMVPIIQELKLLGFMDQFDVRIEPKYYCRLISCYLEILLNQYIV